MCIVSAATPFLNRSYCPEDVLPNVQYQPAKVKELLRLSNLDITSDAIDFSEFVNLEVS